MGNKSKKIRITFDMTEEAPVRAGYYWAVKKGKGIPEIVSVVRNSDKAWVQGFEWIEDKTKQRVDGNIQGYVPVYVSIPLDVYELWSCEIPNPTGYPVLSD